MPDYILNLLSESSYSEKMDTNNALLAAIASNNGGLAVKSWSDVQKIVRLGLADKVFAVADQFMTQKNSESLTFDILDYNKHKPKNKYFSHSLVLGLHNILTYGTIPFCAPQLMYYTEGGLPAGNYKFTLDHATNNGGTQYDGTYMFTLTHPIPADGGLRHTHPIGAWKTVYNQSDVIGNYITTYGARPQRTEVEKDVEVKIWDGTTVCTNLGTFTGYNLKYHTENDDINGGKRNFTVRQAYGSNRWRDSVHRQYLNSDAPAVDSSDATTVSNWWTPQTVFDRVPDGAQLAGFLNGLDPDFVSALDTVEVITSLCDCDRIDGATYDVTYDKVWLQSMTEVFGGTNNNIAEGGQLAYWVGTTDVERIKYDGTTPRFWQLRTPSPTGGSTLRGVDTPGVLNTTNASSKAGIVPACCII